MTDSEDEEMLRLAKEATPGRWELQDGSSWRRIGTREGDGNVLCPCNPSSDRHPDLCAGRGEDIYANLRFIVAAQPSWVTAHIEAKRASERRVEELEAAAQAVMKARRDYKAWVTGGPAGRAILAMAGVEDDRSLRAQSEAAFALMEAALTPSTTPEGDQP